MLGHLVIECASRLVADLRLPVHTRASGATCGLIHRLDEASADAATARTPELAIHLRMARRQGWSEDELIEVLLHLSGYVGVPLIREAMLTAKEVFADMKKER